MAETESHKISRGTLVLRLMTAILVVLMCFFKLFLTYRGLDQPIAMDQAQIARSVASGQGFSTKLLRPIEVMTADAVASKDQGLDLDHFKDSNYAPLNIAAIAAALKLTGYDRFEETRLTEEDKTYIYPGDRVVSATSALFTLLAFFLAYALIVRLFDDVVACSTITFLALSDLVLQYMASGLPQPLMLCFLLAGMHAAVSAIEAERHAEHGWARFYAALGFAALALMSLTGWMGIWIALGFIVFSGFYFKPFGSYSVMGLVILAAALLPSALNNSATTGSLMGNAVYSIYNCFGGAEETIMRSAHCNVPLNNSNFVLRLLGYAFGQASSMYVNMGAILVTPFFILALLNKYKKDEVQGLKWAILSMWYFASLGMALYGITTPINGSQLAILFAPLFTAYGISLVFNFIARLKIEGATFNQVRGLVIFLMLIVSAGPLLSALPRDIYMGIWLSDKGRPHFPPYYPTALNTKLADMSNEQDAIATDQPWAVAWYANRKALWLPLRIEDYDTFLEPTLNKHKVGVQGILITPSSHSPNKDIADGQPGGLAGVVNEMGDFAPLAMEGKLLLLVPRHNLAFADLFMENATEGNRAKPLGEIVSSRGVFSNRTPLLGTEIMYYSKPSAKK